MTQMELDGMPDAGWIAPPSPEHHPCEIPAMTYADASRPWKCGLCGAVWTLHRSHTDQRLAELVASLESQAMPRPMPIPSYVGPESLVTPTPLTVVREDRYAATDPTAPAVYSEPSSNLSDINEHAATCPHRAGTGMCACHVRKTL